MPTPLKLFKMVMIFARSLLAVALLIGIVFFIGIYIVRPRQVMRRFDAFCARRPVGSSFNELLDDAFVDEITLSDARGFVSRYGSSRGEGLRKLRAELKSQGSGTVELMWTHTPPFGRLILNIEFKNNVVTALKVSELD